MVMGNVEMSDPYCANVADKLNVFVASVEYRLAPEHPFPAPLEDCYAGLAWLWDSREELGIDPARIAVGGGSAGGGLAAGVALAARDRGEIELCYQLLVYPMLDDRNETRSSHAITGRANLEPRGKRRGLERVSLGERGRRRRVALRRPGPRDGPRGSAAGLHQRRRPRFVRRRGCRLCTGTGRRRASRSSCTCTRGRTTGRAEQSRPRFCRGAGQQTNSRRWVARWLDRGRSTPWT